MIETARLRLRPWRVSEAGIHRRLWTERDPRVPPHRKIGADGRPSRADLEEWVRGAPARPGFGLPAVEVRAGGGVIGYCGLTENPRVPAGEPELAYELLVSSWGHGYATEAASAVVDWARDAGYQRLWATVRDWNVASRRVLEKLGFVETSRVDPDPVHGDSIFTTLSLNPPDQP